MLHEKQKQQPVSYSVGYEPDASTAILAGRKVTTEQSAPHDYFFRLILDRSVLLLLC